MLAHADWSRWRRWATGWAYAASPIALLGVVMLPDQLWILAGTGAAALALIAVATTRSMLAQWSGAGETPSISPPAPWDGAAALIRCVLVAATVAVALVGVAHVSGWLVLLVLLAAALTSPLGIELLSGS